MNVKHRVVMDLAQKGVTPCIFAVQGDSGTRTLIAELQSNGLSWEIPAGTALLVRYRKPDGTGGVYDSLPDGTKAWSAEGSTLTVALAPQVFTARGTVEMELTLLKEQQQISTFLLELRVSGQLPEGEESRDYVNLASWMAAYGGGVSVTDASIDDRGHLILTLSDGRVQDAGKAAGRDGATPQRGVDYWTEADQADMAERAAQQAAAKVRLPGRNLLDNGDFLNPVNQRGQVSYTANGYGLDRWEGKSGNVEVTETGVKLTSQSSTSGSTLTQYVDDLPDGIYTFACQVGGQIYTRTISKTGTTVSTLDGSHANYGDGYISTIYSGQHGNFAVQLRADAGCAVVFEWAALYEGTYTPETLPPYGARGWKEELEACRRYYQKCPVYPTTPWFSTGGERRYTLTWKEMQTVPTLIPALAEKRGLTENGGTYSGVSDIQRDFALVRFTGTVPDGLCYIQGTVELTADL